MYTIPIHGEIGVDVTLSDVAYHMNEAKNDTNIMLDINSLGGYCDDEKEISQFLLNSGKTLHSVNTGDVASAASKIFTLPEIDNRNFDPTKGMFLIHNPWGEMAGDSAALENASKELKKTEKDYLAHYSKMTGSNEDVLQVFMDKDVPLSPDEIKNLGFANLLTRKIKAIAKIKTNEKMSEEKKDSALVKALNKLEAKVDKFLKPKAIVLADANGNELNFDVATEDEIIVGTPVMVDGSPANDSYTMSDGTVFVGVDGVVSEIIAPESDDDTQALKDEIEALKTELESLKASKAEVDGKAEESEQIVAEIKEEFKAFKAKFSKGEIKATDAPSGDVVVNKVFGYKKK